ncbi:MAG: hypothetical protein JSV84_15940 [Gemmatimonadota bacterium]|nr:MAG: hypothetical protein JSV84_15940 [Gemmatimonadota bacterium]
MGCILACGVLSGQESSPNYGDTLVIGEIGNGLKNLNPIFYTLDQEKEIADYIYGEGLISLDRQGTAVPGLAESWEYSQDRSIWTFQLREGILFHNNVPLESGDVVFTYNLYRNVKTDSHYFYNKNFDVIERVIEDGDRRVRFELQGPYEKFFPELATLQILPSQIYNSGTYEATRDSILHSTPVGLGPFIFSRWEDREKIVLRANPFYYRGRPYLNGLSIQFHATEELLKAAFVTGEIDFARIEEEASARDVWRSNPRIRLVTLVSNQKVFECISYNVSKKLFSKGATRTALTYAINRVGIIDEVLSGKGNIAYGPLDSDSWAYYPNLPKYHFNPKKALELLNEEGWSDIDRDGVLENGDQEFRFTLMFARGSGLFERIARIVKLDLKEIGVDVIPEPVEYKEMMRLMKEGDYDAALMSFPSEAKVENFDRLFHSSNIGRGLNVMYYYNREVDRLINLAYEVSDRNRLEPMFQRMQLLIAQDQSCTFLFFRWLFYTAVDTRFQNIRHPNGGLKPFPEWWVPEEAQKY